VLFARPDYSSDILICTYYRLGVFDTRVVTVLDFLFFVCFSSVLGKTAVLVTVTTLFNTESWSQNMSGPYFEVVLILVLKLRVELGASS